MLYAKRLAPPIPTAFLIEGYASGAPFTLTKLLQICQHSAISYQLRRGFPDQQHSAALSTAAGSSLDVARSSDSSAMDVAARPEPRQFWKTRKASEDQRFGGHW